MPARALLFAALLAVAGAGLLQPLSATASQTAPPQFSDDWWNPYGAREEEWQPHRLGPTQRSRMVRHWTYLNQGVPEAYRGSKNPFGADFAAVKQGAALYAEHCARCHGATGNGDGREGRGLSPSPALLSHMIRVPLAVDEYLLWSISDGGGDFGSDMPAFGEVLDPAPVWKIISFMRAGFPPGLAP